MFDIYFLNVKSRDYMKLWDVDTCLDWVKISDGRSRFVQPLSIPFQTTLVLSNTESDLLSKKKPKAKYS